MLKIYICEDDSKQRDKMNSLVDEIIAESQFDMEKAVVTDNPFEIIDAVSNSSDAGVFFLDIDLNAEIDGLELANKVRALQPRCFIVFVTTHSEMAFMTFSYRVEAMDFIIKDNATEIKARVQQCLCQAHERSMYKAKKGYFIKIGDNIRMISYDDILYFEVAPDSKKLLVHTVDAIIEFSGKLKDVEASLDERFYRCHRAYIVNRDNIKGVDRENRIIYFDNNESCPMSARLGKGI